MSSGSGVGGEQNAKGGGVEGSQWPVINPEGDPPAADQQVWNHHIETGNALLPEVPGTPMCTAYVSPMVRRIVRKS